jgi:rubrerythrin
MQTKNFFYRIIGIGAAVFSFATIFAEENDSIRELNAQVIQELIEEQDSAILVKQDNPVVQLNFEKIIACAEGIFLKSEKGEHIRIPMLFSNNTGCYALNNQAHEFQQWITCRKCEFTFLANERNHGRCPRCGTKNSYP